jgi:hypothetical protein
MNMKRVTPVRLGRTPERPTRRVLDGQNYDMRKGAICTETYRETE